jgi:hypothetical protein
LARNTFFSFDFDDVRAANIVRNSNVVREAGAKMAFRDHSLYEKLKANPALIKSAIDDGLENTSVTVVITGGATWSSSWVRYEIAKSLERGNGLMVIDVDGVGLEPTPTKGPNPLDYVAAFPPAVATFLGGTTVGIREWNTQTKVWVSFAKLSSFSNDTARYPKSFVTGNPYKLSARFTRRYHWKAAQMYFESYLDGCAQDVNHSRIVWL